MSATIVLDALGPTPSEALLRGDATLAAILDTLASLGFRSPQVRTVPYGVSPVTANDYGQQPNPGGVYFSRTVLRVGLSRPSQIGPLTAAALGKGASFLAPIQFGLKTPDSAKESAIAEALRDARVQAESVARALGMRLGAILDVNIQSGYLPDLQPVQIPASPRFQGYSQSSPEVVQTFPVMVRWRLEPR